MAVWRSRGHGEPAPRCIRAASRGCAFLRGQLAGCRGRRGRRPLRTGGRPVRTNAAASWVGNRCRERCRGIVSLSLWLVPVVGGVIGWVTNLIAIRMLFHPKRPIRIPLLGVTLQGVLPSRHAELAASIGKVAAEELLPVDELVERVDLQGMRTELVQAVAAHVEQRLRAGLGRFMPGQWRDTVVAYVRDAVARETEVLLDPLLDRLRRRVAEQIDVAALVTDKLLALDLDGLEDLAVRVAGRELRAIVLFGAVLGFLIGLVQMAVMMLFLPGNPAG